MAHLFRVLTYKLLPLSTSCHDIITDHLLKHVPLVDFRESARGGAGVQQPGQRVPLSTGLRQGRFLPHAGAGAGAGDGRQSHRDEGVRWSGARRPVHAGRCGRVQRIRRPVKACDCSPVIPRTWSGRTSTTSTSWKSLRSSRTERRRAAPPPTWVGSSGKRSY